MYQKENYSPFGGCLPMILQLFILFALYAVIRKPLTHMLGLSSDVIKALTENAKNVVENLIKYPTDKKAKKWLLKNRNFRTNNSKINMKMKISIILIKF